MPAPQQKILVLTGMHRSGTSLLAKLASRAGIDMGAELLEGSKGNRHGHFEDLEVVRFHEDCLSRRGLGPFRLPEGGVSSFLPEEERQAAAIVERRRGHRGDRSHRGDRGRGAWGFKDPRTSLFLPLWDRLLPEAFFLLVYRHPVEVALSLLRRGIDLEVQLDPGTAIRTWTAYNRQLLAFREAHPEHSLLWPISAVVENLGAAWEILTDRSGLPPSDTGNGRLYEPAELQLGLRAREVDWEAVLPEAMELYARLGACADLRETREPSTVRPVPTREGELQEASEILLATVLARAGTPETETGSVIAERHRIDYSQLKRVVNHQAERLRWLGARLEALEREQMLLAETRALRLVKSYWRATRWGKGVKRQAAWRLRQLAGRVPPPPPEEIVVACVAENNPLFLTQALRLALSLRWFGGALARARMQVCVVDGIAAEDRRRLTEAGAEVVIVERFDRRNSPANKLQLFAPALASGARGVLLLDCDTVVVRDPYPLLVGGALQAKIVDVPSVTHDAFERAFRHYGLTLPRARYRTTMLPKERTIFHCNTGVLFLTTEVAKEIVPVWREWNARILDTLHLLGSCAHHCHQASLSLAFSEHSVPFAETPAAFNFPLHMTHLPIVPQLLKIDPAILHYHGEVDPEGLLRPTRYPLAQARIEAFNRRFQAKAQE